MKKFSIVLLMTIMVVAFSVTTFAATMPAQTQAQAQTRVQTSSASSKYPAGPIQKAERGFTNIAFGWTEIPKRVVDKTKESNPIKGLFLGLWQGTCKAFARTASGVGDLVTFPIGGYEKPAILPDMPAAK